MSIPVNGFVRFEDRVPIEVFVVSPDARLREDLSEKLGLPRWHVIQATGGAEALKLLRQHGADNAVLLLDPRLRDLEANEFNGIVQDRFPNIQVLVLNSNTGRILVGSASPTPISRKIADAINGNGTLAANPAGVPASHHAHSPVDGRVKLRGMIGDSELMMRVYELTRMVAPRNTTVLITGESGTGKDLVAQAVHLISGRRNQPFMVVNCAAIPEALLEAELFGYTKGSFTGAVQSRIGRIQAAHGGTLFLDEIGDMPLSLQSKILRFLEQGEVQRLGGNENLKVDVRVIAATNADLKARAQEQRFREDLFYRLAVFPIHLPPLRERPGDVEQLATAFAAKFDPRIALHEEALQVLRQHTWPGNVRELRNAIERAAILVGDGSELKAKHLVL